MIIPAAGTSSELHNDILTVAEVARELRCSKAHAYRAILGLISGVSRLPFISMGRRKLIRRSSLEQWKRDNEHASPGATIDPSLEIHAVDA